MRRFVPALALLLVLAAARLGAGAPADRPVIIGSKEDAEGALLGEIMAQLLEDRGFPVERRFRLGGTLICFEALKNGAADVYPEYSGTLEQAILKFPGRTSNARLRAELQRRYGMELLDFFGFNNTYALVVRRELSERRNLKTISDLAGQAGNLRLAFSNEFLNRPDGWLGLARAYDISATPVGISHALAYGAIDTDQLDVTDGYGTDGQIKKYDLVALEDDRHFFPSYLAAPLVRDGVDDGVKHVLEELGGQITEAEMRSLNLAVLDGKDAADVARQFLHGKGLLAGTREAPPSAPRERGIDWGFLLRCTGIHLELTVLSLLAGMAVAIPLGVVVYRLGTVSRTVMYAAGVLQTIPSIALLAFLIPLFGIGWRPAVVALFLYALLPILRNTAAALFSIDPVLRKVSVGMGLTAWQRLRYVELPLAAPTILAGIKTAAIINIGTATLAAFIGAGGLGEPIVTGLALNDTALILQGAIPAALLAVLTERGFEWLERLLVPKHLLQRQAE
jgi:osmoprotectant transport system permease protein